MQNDWNTGCTCGGWNEAWTDSDGVVDWRPTTILWGLPLHCKVHTVPTILLDNGSGCSRRKRETCIAIITLGYQQQIVIYGCSNCLDDKGILADSLETKKYNINIKSNCQHTGSAHCNVLCQICVCWVIQGVWPLYYFNICTEYATHL